ncbi:hypothetical protein Pan153_18270 [Gimesia panareensis]|uniref:TIGR03067 domain-containing protein n=1 Tax=Gimesia panareensis TaxID=2527978 RepID=A0A518FLF4_9PLAN|nr:hypothetical protein [Gimesia panareensis]QDV17192.1 hypothetical protein Pan153_18270 [Gimesia panareensis]
MQKLEKSALILCLYIVQVGLVSADDQGIAEQVYQQTNGNWQLVKFVEDGVTAPAEDLKNIRMELKNGTWTARKGDIIIGQGTYKVLSLKDGYRIVSSKVTLGNNAGKTGQHISKSEGDILTICHPPEGQAAPTEFTSNKGSGNQLRVWKRIRK